jgi:signal peptidase I
VSTREKLKKSLKNEWVKTGIMLAIVLVAFFSLWFGIRYALATEYPLLAVASPSMVPTLNVGDLIVVHGVSNASEIYAHPVIKDPQTGKISDGGDIIVFHTYLPEYVLNLRSGGPEELIVHRAVNKTVIWDNRVGRNVTYFTTKGDNNPSEDRWSGTGDGVPEYYVVGKVVGTVPWVGSIPLYIRTTEGILTVIVLIIIVVFAEFVYSSFKEKKKPPQIEDQPS